MNRSNQPLPRRQRRGPIEVHWRWRGQRYVLLFHDDNVVAPLKYPRWNPRLHVEQLFHDDNVVAPLKFGVGNWVEPDWPPLPRRQRRGPIEVRLSGSQDVAEEALPRRQRRGPIEVSNC